MAACTAIIANTPVFGGTDGLGISNFTIDASTDAVEWIFQAEEAATITHVGIRQGTYAGTAGKVYRVSLQSLDTSTNPSGTILGATNNGYNDYTASTANNSTWQKLALGESVTVTRGQWLSCVIKFQSGTTPSGTETCSFGSAVQGAGSITITPNNPMPIQNNGGSRTRYGYVGIFAYYSASKTYGCPISAVSSVLYNVDTAGADEYGVQFSLPATWGSTYKLRGAYACLDMPAGSTHDMTLWSNASPPVNLATVNFDTDIRRTSGEARWQRILFTDTTLPTLDFGTTYNLTIFNNSTSNNRLYNFDVNAVDDFAAWPWGEVTMHEAKRLNAASSFTTTTTRRPLICLIVDDWTKPNSGGGVVIPGRTSSISRR